MAIIAPSILSADFTKLGEEMTELQNCGVKVVHIDIMDGCFVPNLTFGYTMVQALKAYKGNMKFDVHLMMEHPYDYIDKFIDAGADMLTIHLECSDDIGLCLDKIRDRGITAGISIKPKTDPNNIIPYVGKFSQCLIMTVEPGFGGQKIIIECLDKIGKVKKLCEGLDVCMAVDGGINAENASYAAQCGADLIVAGNAVFAAEDRRLAFATLTDIVSSVNKGESEQ